MGSTMSSSNVYLTKEWILIIPRKADRVFHGVSFNSLGMLGSIKLPAEREDLVNEIRVTGIEKIL